MKVYVCFLGLHKWRYFRGKKYPEDYRICGRCGRTEELRYNLIDAEWVPNPERIWLAPGDIEITQKEFKK